MTDSEKRRGDTQAHSESLSETALCFYDFARSAGLAKAFGVGVRCVFASLSSCNQPGTSLECPAERRMALELLKRVTEAFDLRSKPCSDEMAKFIIVVFRIMFAGGAVVLG